jgi:hypothetical protein
MDRAAQEWRPRAEAQPMKAASRLYSRAPSRRPATRKRLACSLPSDQARAGVLQAAVDASEGVLANRSHSGHALSGSSAAMGACAAAHIDGSGGPCPPGGAPSAGSGISAGGAQTGSAASPGGYPPGSPRRCGPVTRTDSGGGGCLNPEFLWLYREYIAKLRGRERPDGTCRPLELGEEYFPPNKGLMRMSTRMSLEDTNVLLRTDMERGVVVEALPAGHWKRVAGGMQLR